MPPGTLLPKFENTPGYWYLPWLLALIQCRTLGANVCTTYLVSHGAYAIQLQLRCIGYVCLLNTYEMLSNFRLCNTIHFILSQWSQIWWIRLLLFCQQPKRDCFRTQKMSWLSNSRNNRSRIDCSKLNLEQTLCTTLMSLSVHWKKRVCFITLYGSLLANRKKANCLNTWGIVTININMRPENKKKS